MKAIGPRRIPEPNRKIWDSTEGFRGDSGGIPRDSVWVCRDSMGFRVVETMSFHTSGTSGISLIIILEARMLEIPGCESPYLALSSSGYQALYLPLVSTVLEFYYRRDPSVASLTYRLSVKNHWLEDRLINYIVCTEALASRVVHQVQRALTRGALPSSCSLGQTLTPLFKTRRQAHRELSAQT